MAATPPFGLVLIRQKPGSAKGVMFLTLEDETGIANVVVWPDLFERERRLIVDSGMIGVAGLIQREGAVIHLVAIKLIDFSEMLRAVGEIEDGFAWSTGRGDEMRHGGSPDQRPLGERVRRGHLLGRHPRDIYIPEFVEGNNKRPVERRVDVEVKTRDFR